MSELSIILEFARTGSPEDPYAFQFGLQGYTLRSSSGGRKRVELDWNDDFLDDLQELGQPQVAPASMQRVGRQLRTFLEPAGWASTSRDIVDAIRQSRPVHLTIRSAAAELYSLPWELLTLEGTGQCVGEIPGLLVRYEWPDTSTIPAAVPEGGRILVAWSAAAGAVPSAQHITAIESAARDGGFDFDADRDVIDDASVGRIADALDEGVRTGRPVVALHVLCHGGAAGDVYGLVLDGESPGSDVVVDGWRLRQLLAPYGSTLRLAVISACESANSSGLFDSAVLALHRTGIQAVMASRFLFSVAGSISLTRTLYRELLVSKCSLEEAFLRGRRALARDAAKLDWASLQLYARESDGHETFPFSATGASPGASDADIITGEHEVLDGQGASLESLDYDTLKMADLVELRSRARDELQSRFERTMAIMVIDLGRSAARLVRAPEGSPQSLIARFRGLVESHLDGTDGRFYTTSSTRLDLCFPDVQGALDFVFAMAEPIIAYNYKAKRDELIVPRLGLHHGPVLTDGDAVAGDACKTAVSIAAASPGNVLWMSEEALAQTSTLIRASCRFLEGTEVIGEGKPHGLYKLSLRDGEMEPDLVVIENTGEQLQLPSQDIISFGRLDKLPDGTPANDICLTMPDRNAQLVISRWHLEVRRGLGGGYVIRVLSGQPTEVDGKLIAKGQEAPVQPGTNVSLANKVKLRIEGVAAAPSTRIEMTRYED